MSYRPTFSLIQAPIALDPDPNVTPPAAPRGLIQVPQKPGRVVLYCGDGTSLGITPYFFCPDLNLWIQHSAAATVTTGTMSSGFASLPDRSQLFLRVTANTGAVSKFAARILA